MMRFSEIEIVRYQKGERKLIKDMVINEEPIQLIINGEKVTTFYCTPDDLEELAVGWAFCRGIISGRRQVGSVNVDICNSKIDMNVLSSGPKGEGVLLYQKEFAFSAEEIYDIWTRFDDKSETFMMTGACHSVGLVTRKDILCIKEDVARHNALQKVIGAMVLEELFLNETALVFSGRLGCDMLKMAEKSGVKLLIAHGTTTLLSIQAAEAAGITLTGFVKSGYMNVYTHPKRVK